MISEAFQWTKQPVNPTIVVEGVNNTKVSLLWEYVLSQGESIASITVSRGRPDSAERETFAVQGSNPLRVTRFQNKYNVAPPLTVELLDLKNKEEYVYFIDVVSSTGDTPSSQVRIIVNGKFRLILD